MHDQNRLIVSFEPEEGWKELTPNVKLDPRDQVGYWENETWICEYVCDSSTEDLIYKYFFMFYRRMNPPILIPQAKS